MYGFSVFYMMRRENTRDVGTGQGTMFAKLLKLSPCLTCIKNHYSVLYKYPKARRT